jgi:SAM-dependent methyltransferase
MEALEVRTAAAGTPRDAYDAFAERYDAFTWDHDYEDWVSTLEEVARAHGLTGDRVLDVACGTGKSLVPWLQRGRQVVGCDLSAGMLARAREKVGDRARLEVADMRRLPPGAPVDLVTCLGDSVNYLLDPRDLDAAFASAAARLRPGGLYLFDVNTLRTYREDFATTRRFRQDGWEFRWSGHGDGQARPGRIASATVTARRVGAAGAPVMTSRHVQRHPPPALVRNCLESAGLECRRVHGQHRDGALDPELAELVHSKALVVARKPALP